MEDIKQILEKLEDILNIPITEMAQKQGQDSIFVYYTLDNEFISHYPHVHVCVPNNNKHWGDSNFKNGQNLKTVGSVFLPFEQLRDKIPFTVDNIEFEVVDDKKVINKKYVQIICNWLNQETEDDFGNKINNAVKCFNDYKMSNGDKCLYLKKLKGNRNEF